MVIGHVTGWRVNASLVAWPVREPVLSQRSRLPAQTASDRARRAEWSTNWITTRCPPCRLIDDVRVGRHNVLSR